MTLIIDDECEPYIMATIEGEDEMGNKATKSYNMDIMDVIINEFPNVKRYTFIEPVKSFFAKYGNAGTVILDGHKIHWIIDEAEAYKIAYRFITRVLQTNPKAFNLDWLLQFFDTNRFINYLHDGGLKGVIVTKEEVIEYLRDEGLSEDDIIETIAPEYIDMFEAAQGGIIEFGWEYFFGLASGSFNICKESTVIYFDYLDKDTDPDDTALGEKMKALKDNFKKTFKEEE